MTTVTVISLGILILLTAILYSSVGHGGGSGYLAAMALFSVTPMVMKPTALVLGMLVAGIGTFKYFRAGFFRWPVFWPFALGSIPSAFVGGSLALPASVYNPIVGSILLLAAFRLFRTAAVITKEMVKTAPLWLAILSGIVIGLLSGMTGVGGGLFLGPLLLFTGWAETRQSSGITAAFIFVNSIAGLSGHLSRVDSLPGIIPFWAGAAILGGWIGAEFGSRRLNKATLRKVLALVLLVAGSKMILDW
ncbi:MAG: sulfite exporter TauE/SafE family protein [SAR324 cluster bacterium]|nr:sulfite exporter TauE/SafE family protein [SAR324 cluster bacterium]